MRNFVLILSLTAGLVLAQPADLKTMSGHAVTLQNQVKTAIIKSAEKMPAEDYAFRPTPDVRSYAELIAHVTDANYLFCTASIGDRNQGPKLEEQVKKNPAMAKAAIVEALTASFAYCDKAFTALTDANAAETIKFFGSDRARIGVLSFETSHLFEHYGNIVTYLRMKKIVPPSSERR